MRDVKTKKRQEKEYYEKYCKITIAYSNFYGKKFIKALRIIVEDIKLRGYREASSKEYHALNAKILQEPINNVGGKNPEGTIRKVINTYAKLGFTEPGLNKFHEDVPEYLDAPSDELRKVLFSIIVTENSKLSTSYKERNNPKKNFNYIPFITKTLMKAGELNQKQIIGLLTVDPFNFEEGFIDIKNLNHISNSAHKNNFFKKKYNQVRFFKQILGKLDKFSYSTGQEKLLGFKIDQDKKYKTEIRNKKLIRESKFDNIAYKKIDLENLRATGEKKRCMVNNIAYPTIIHSHIKRSKLSNILEKYHEKNLLILCSEIDTPFDKGDISFDDEGEIIFANNINEALKKTLYRKKINKLFMDKERKAFLKWNRENWFNKNPNRHN